MLRAEGEVCLLMQPWLAGGACAAVCRSYDSAIWMHQRNHLTKPPSLHVLRIWAVRMCMACSET